MEPSGLDFREVYSRRRRAFADAWTAAAETGREPYRVYTGQMFYRPDPAAVLSKNEEYGYRRENIYQQQLKRDS